MEADTFTSPPPQRPQHRRNASSKSNILRALVSPRARADGSEIPQSSRQGTRTQTVPLLPPDHPHAATKGRVLGERQGNMQSPPSSPSKSRQKSMVASKTSNDLRATQAPKKSVRGESSSPKKSKSSTNLSAVFAKMNRSNKDLSTQATKDKENTTPPSSSHGAGETPIWAQYATSGNKRESRPSTREGIDLKDEIARYTPKEYSPSKQRNFNGSFEQPHIKPTLCNRPQSMYALGSEVFGAVGRRMSGDRTSLGGRKSEDMHRQVSNEAVVDKKHKPDRKTSGSSAEQPAKEKLNIAKRGGRVMAAVAAFQGKSKEQVVVKEESPLDPKAVDKAFEAVLESRNVPEPMKQKMRSLTLRVKADFVKQDQEAMKGSTITPPGTASIDHAYAKLDGKADNSSPVDERTLEDDGKSTKRSRPRSRTLTFSKADKRGGDTSPSKKQRSQSRSRPISTCEESPTTPTTPRSSFDKRRSATALPAEYIAYIRKHQDPVKLEVGRLHKLRILLRNETVAWVDSFVSLGGMSEIVGLLYRIMAVEWREEHEDQLLHETLLCLKGLCTTERAMTELEKVADELFPALLAMLFDDEKKGPAEYCTRGIIITVLFSFLSSATSSSAGALEQRARRILGYLGEPSKPEDARPVDFVLDMRVPRPYKLWCREITHVTKEVFWIFLHHLNVVPLPKPSSKDGETECSSPERAKVLAATYTQCHFPGTRPPVPAAPYIGGVEWDATTYITAHLDLLNGLLASVPTSAARNALRAELKESGLEKVLGATLRTCKEKFYSGVHDGLRAWVAAASEDGWETLYVREGPTQEEQAKGYSPRKSPGKKDAPPKLDNPLLNLEPPKLDLGIDEKEKFVSAGDFTDGNDNGWLG